jgi:ribosomal protein S18 acetylase RimI-like enzyme
LRRVKVEVEVLAEISSEVVEAFDRLLPQLSTSAPALDEAKLSAIIAASASTVLLARAGGQIVGTLTLAMFPIPTGVRAWIEDVVVDESARGNRVGEALTLAAVQLAKDAGARTVDLTSRPSRASAGRLYERLGFKLRESRLYRYQMT